MPITKKTPVIIPTEDQEQAQLVEWLQLRHFPHFRVPNETYTKSWSQKAKNKALGVSSGAPDLFVIVVRANGTSQLIAIEMKRTKNYEIRADQRQWIDDLSKAGTPARICLGCQAAIDFVLEIYNQGK